MRLYGQEPLQVSHQPCHVWWSLVQCQWRYKVLILCHVTLQNYVIEGSCNFMSGSSSLHITILFAAGHGPCDIKDIKLLVCHMILRDYVIKGSCDFMVRSPSWQVINLPSLVVIGIVVVETMFLVSHMISKQHVIKESCGFKGKQFLMVSEDSATFGDNRSFCASGDIVHTKWCGRFPN